jgi:hypothetical protein
LDKLCSDVCWIAVAGVRIMIFIVFFDSSDVVQSGGREKRIKIKPFSMIFLDSCVCRPKRDGKAYQNRPKVTNRLHPSSLAMALLLRHRLPPPEMPLLLAFLFAATAHGAAYGDYRYNTSMCLQQHHCGNVSIEYPFYLYNETADLLGNDDSSYCGYPGLEIRCEDSKQAILRLRDDNYSVSNINYTDFTVTVVDQEVLKDKSCPRVDHNVTFPIISSSFSAAPSVPGR